MYTIEELLQKRKEIDSEYERRRKLIFDMEEKSHNFLVPIFSSTSKEELNKLSEWYRYNIEKIDECIDEIRANSKI